MKFIGVIFSLVVVISSSTIANAAAEKFDLDKDHTYVGFDVSYLVVGRVAGRFNDFQGSFVIDSNHPEQSLADIIIKTGSVDTGVKSWNDDIRGSGLFDTKHHPTMLFHSKKIKLDTENTGSIAGDLTLLGVTKPIILDFVRMPQGKWQRPLNSDVYADGFIITGKIKRSDFGMNAYIRPIGNTVTLYVCYNTEKCDDKDTQQEQIKERYNN